MGSRVTLRHLAVVALWLVGALAGTGDLVAQGSGYSVFALPLESMSDTSATEQTGVSLGSSYPDLHTGALAAAYPLQAPAGRHGLAPELALTYSSRRGNGPVGVGWLLEPGGIERDAERGMDYSASKYVLANASGTRKLIAGAQGSEFQLEIEGTFARIRYLVSPDGERYFELSQKDGLRFLYGRSPATQVFDPGAPDRVFRWCLDRVEDRFGNYMEFGYERDGGQLYLTRVDYNGHSKIKPTHSIELIWEARPDVIRSARPGFELITAKRLRSVIVTAEGRRVHGYELRYDMAPGSTDDQPSPATGRSLLTDVYAHASDAQTRLRPLHLAYHGSSGSFSRQQPGAGGISGSVAERCLVGDLNADGVSDVACLDNLHGTWGISIARPEGWSTKKWTNGPVPKLKTRVSFDRFLRFPILRPSIEETTELAHSCFSGDFNLDRRLDVACYTGGGGRWQVGLSTGEAWQTAVWGGGANPGEPVTDKCLAGDFDGDFVTEIACHEDDSNWQMMEPASGSWKTSKWGSGPSPSHPIGLACLPGDYDGDMALDLACRLGGLWRVGLSRKDRWETTTWPDGPAVEQPLGVRCFSGDFSGDGIADIACAAGGRSWSVALSTTRGWHLTTWSDGPSTEEPVFDRCLTADLEGDGRTDLACHEGSGTWYASLSRNDRFLTARWSNGPEISRPVWKHCRSGDFNGDGRADLLCNPEEASRWSLALAAGKPPDLLTGLVNAIGGSIAIDYEASTARRDQQMPFVAHVVTRVKRSSGHGADSEVTFAYDGGYFHVAKGEFRGFRHVEERGPFEAGSGVVTKRWFFQGNGMGEAEREAPVGYMQGRVYKQQSRGSSGHVYETVTYRYKQDDTAPFFNPIREVRRWTCDPEAQPVCGKETLSEYTYDSYGNVTAEALHGDRGDPTDDRSLRRTFGHNRDEWLLSFPISEQLYRGVQGGGELLSTSNFYYDGASDCSAPAGQQIPSRGALSRVERWLSGGDSLQTLFGFDEYGNTACMRDPRGYVTTFEFDPTKTFPTATTNPLGHRLTTTYYGVAGEDVAGGLYGRQKRVQDPNGAATTWTWDGFGRLVELRQADGGITRSRYKLLGNPGLQYVEIEDAAGLIRQIYFDGFGRTWSYRESATGGRTAIVTMRTDARGLLRGRTLPYFVDEPPAPEFAFEYDELGRLTRTTMPNGAHDLRCYDDDGRVEVHVGAQGNRSRVVLDAMGRMRRVQQYLGAYSSCETWERLEVLDTEQQARLTAIFGAPVSAVIAPYSENRLDYDLLGNLVRLQDAMGNITEIQFDRLSRKLRLADSNLGEWHYEYDANGNLTRETNPTGDSVFLQYDPLNRLVQKDLKRVKSQARADYRYDYDVRDRQFGMGRLARVRYPAGEVELVYDVLGRVVERRERVDKKSFVSRFAYDRIGRIAAVTYPDNSVYRYRYDGPSLSRVEAGQELIAEYRGYNAFGQPAEQRFGNGVRTRYSYSGDPGTPCAATSRQLCQIEMRKPSGESLLRLRYFHDRAGRVAAIDDSMLGLQHFEHDELGRLVERSVAAGSAPDEVILPAAEQRIPDPEREIAALLDLAREDRQQLGQLLAANADFATLVKAAWKRREELFPSPSLAPADGWVRTEQIRYNPVGSITYRSGVGPYHYPPSGAASRLPHAVIRTREGSLSYDAQGNMSASPGRTYRFDVEGRLVRVEQAESTVEYSYDYTGERVRKQFSWRRTDSRGHLSVGGYDSISPSRLYQCVGKRCVKHLFADRQRIAVEDVTSGERFYFGGDHLGSIRLVTDSSGNIVELRSYTPFGTWLQSNGDSPPLPTVYGFTGQEYDPEVGLYYLGARYYDPELSRFLSGDPQSSGLAGTQTLNRYSYALNQPLMFVDPDGEWIIFVAAAVVGALAAGSQSNWDPGAMVLGAIVGAASAGVGSVVGGAVSGAVGGGMAGTLAGGAAGGAAGAATGALMYRAAGYDVDVGRAALAGAAGGFFGASFSAATSPMVGGLIGGGVSAAVSGGDFGQGAFWGAVGAIATASALSAAPEDGEMVDAAGKNMKEPGVYAIKGAGSVLERLWHLILGDAYSHVVVSLGNGQFGDATPTVDGVEVESGTYSTGDPRYQQLVGRQFVKANVDLSASMQQIQARLPDAAGRSYGFGPSQFVCTTYATYLTGGQVSGLMPGQMVYNTIGYRPGYYYYDYTIHRREE